MAELQIIGRNEPVDLPELGLFKVMAKVDTGAYNCVLHCSEVRIKGTILECWIPDDISPGFAGRWLTFNHFTQKEIRNSFGEKELRFVIKTVIEIFRKKIRAEFSLTNRGNLRFPVLLGRKILRNRFLVDVTKKNLGESYLDQSENQF